MLDEYYGSINVCRSEDMLLCYDVLVKKGTNRQFSIYRAYIITMKFWARGHLETTLNVSGFLGCWVIKKCMVFG